MGCEPPRWAYARARVERDSGGNPVRLAGVVMDVTEQKAAEAAAAQGEAKFRQLAETIPQLAWMAKADGCIFWYNRRWYEYTGTTPEQMEGWGWQSVHDPDELPGVMERWQLSIRTGEPFEMEFPLKGADGRFRWFLTRVAPLRDADGKIALWFGTNTDIEERRQVAEERAQLLEAERAAQRRSRAQPDEGRVPRHAVARAAHAAERDPRLVADPQRRRQQNARTWPRGCETIERNARVAGADHRRPAGHEPDHLRQDAAGRAAGRPAGRASHARRSRRSGRPPRPRGSACRR